MTTKLAKHTPGPWRANERFPGSVNDRFVYPLAGTAIASIFGSRGVAECDANARLIAAVPEMLEALELVRMSLGWQYLSAESKTVIDTAICAAVGEQEENTHS